jgi:peptidoglycan/xylan/chitin deacetylase (PgdA/CDA1 family)
MPATFSCSLDDGHPSDRKAVEILSKNDVNATFYIPIRNCEDRQILSKSEIREIGNEFEIGSHTHDHCFLKNLPIEEARYQVIDGKKKLEDMLGRQVSGFCYPGGKYGHKHVELVKDAGFQYARTTMNLCFDTGDRPFEIPTTFQFYPHDRSVYLRNFVKGGNWLKRFNGLRLALQHENWIDRLYALFEHASEHDEVFHLWGHSKDIDELNAWHEFDRFIAHVATKVAPKNRLTNEQLATRGFLSAIPDRLSTTA